MDDSGVYLTVSAPPSPLLGSSLEGSGEGGLLPAPAPPGPYTPTPGATCPLLPGRTTAAAGAEPGEHCGVEMLCFEDPSSLSPTVPGSDSPSDNKTSNTSKDNVPPNRGQNISTKRPRKDSYSELPHPPNTPIKRRRLSKTRPSITTDIQTSETSTNSQESTTVMAPLQLPAHLHLAGLAESSSCADDRKRVLQAQEVDHAGFLQYEMDIYLHRRSIELNYHPVECLLNQPQLTPGMRGVLVEWLTKLCRRFAFAQDTLFLTVNVLDRFLVTTPISRDIFQLLGITSLLVAAKQEEQYPPEIAELLQLCEDTYSREQVRQLERVVLCRLRFDLMAPTGQFFLEHHAASRLRSADRGDFTRDQVRRTRSVARYLLELSLQDYLLCQYAPSLMALGVLEVSDQLLQHSTRLGALYAGGYSIISLEECMAELRLLTTAFSQSGPDMNVIYERYMNLYTHEEC